MRKYIALAMFFIAVGTAVYYYFHPMIPTVMINGTTFQIELAITPKEMTKGLSGRKDLKPHHGMLFIMDHKAQYTFWMKDMNFPLDIVWIEGNVIKEISFNVLPPKNGKIPMITSSSSIDRVFEVNAGEIKKAGIKVGDTLLYNK